MMVHLLLGLGLLVQGPTASPVRVWLPDTLRPVGDPMRVYVALRDTSHLVVLHVDASGRIRVLFPRSPTDPDLVPGGQTFAVTGSEEGVTFRVPVPGTGNVLAVRSRSPFRFEGLTAGRRWDYEHALVFLPTAGNPFAALLDIADRMADGEAYNYDLAAYRTPGAVATRPVAPDSVCFSCLTARQQTRRAAASTGESDNSAIAIDHSYAAAPGGTVVDCSSATLVDSFCGVQDNSVSTTVEETAVDQSTSVAYPVYTPLFFALRRGRRPPRAPAPPQPAIALNLRRVPGRIVPPPPRRPPRIVVEQPRAPSHPYSITPADGAIDRATPVAAAPAQRILIRRAPQPASVARADPAPGWTAADAMRRSGSASTPRTVAAPTTRAAGVAAQATRPLPVPSRPVARGFANPRR
jgi:hypothetical protein